MYRNDHHISKILSACMLGDGHLRKDFSGGRTGRKAHFRLQQLESHKDHLDYIADALSFTRIVFDYHAPKEHVVIRGKDTRANPSLTLRTMAHPIYDAAWSRWYLNKVKRIDPHALTLIDAEFLAVWYMQDGYTTYRDDCINAETVLCTDCFTYGDLLMMRKAIIEKTGFVFNVRKRSKNTLGEHTYRMFLYRKQADAFREFIAPYIQKSFLYKITGDAYTKRVG